MKSGIRWQWLLYLGVAIAPVAAGFYFDVQDLLKQVLDWVAQLGPWRPIIFIVICDVAAVLFIPASVLTLGATAAYLMGRY